MTFRLSRMFDLVEHWAAAEPDREALIFGEQSWSWAELDTRVRKAAAALQAAGVSAGDRFAVLDKNHPVCLELTLAASVIGAVNVVVNFRLAEEELVYVLGDSAAKLVIVGAEFAETLDRLRDRLPTIQQTVVLGGEKDEYEHWVGQAEPLRELPETTLDDCFLQLYTSGTTGWPKGAMLTQRSMTTHTNAVAPAYEMDQDTVNIVAMPLFHVGGTSWALGSMATGGRTIVVREMTELLPEVAKHQATHAFVVPAVLHALLQHPKTPELLSPLRVLAYGGSPMPAELMNIVLEKLSTPLYSVYGMTEMSGAICCLRPEEHRDETRRHLLASAGRMLGDNELRVVDPTTGRDVPTGELGEFWVRSDQRMAGYWQKPEATQETITEDGWLRTGDAGRVDEDGYLYLEDRVKDMIISGGENIYPAEVERVLAEHPDVADVAVIGVPHPKWGETPKAVVVLNEGATLDEAALIEFTRDKLAHYKCPTSVTAVPALPRNATGKILKRELRAQVQ